MIGYYIGNGSMSQYIDNRGGNKLEKYRIRFHSGRKEPLEYIRQGLFSNFNIKLNSIQKVKRDECFILASSNKTIIDYIFSCNFNHGKKSDIVRIPQFVKDNISLIGYEFLSGLIDSD